MCCKFLSFATIVLMFFVFEVSSVASDNKDVSGAEFQAELSSQQEYLYCPDHRDLQKENGWWKIGNIWKSDSKSSGEKIKSFIGAQWVGVKIGKIICLYSEDEKYSFPVAMMTVQGVLVPEPSSSFWALTKEGYRRCVSNNVFDCPFTQKKLMEDGDLYEQIKYKGMTRQ